MLQGSPILTIYDIRGIQGFIYRTNRIKDVVGGSRIVRTILEEAYQDWCVKKEDPDRYLHSWHEVKPDGTMQPEQAQHVKPFLLLGDPHIQSEVLCFGGGNLMVMYRDNTLAQEASAHIASSVNGGWLGLGRTANGRYIRVCCSGRCVEIRGDSSTLLLRLLLSGIIEYIRFCEIGFSQKHAAERGKKEKRLIILALSEGSITYPHYPKTGFLPISMRRILGSISLLLLLFFGFQ